MRRFKSFAIYAMGISSLRDALLRARVLQPGDMVRRFVPEPRSAPIRAAELIPTSTLGRLQHVGVPHPNSTCKSGGGRGGLMAQMLRVMRWIGARR